SPHRLLLAPAFADAGDARRADALDLLEERRALVDHLQGALAEHLDDLLRVLRADALDQARGEVLLDALGRGRRHGGDLVGLELLAVLRIEDPVAARLDDLAGGDGDDLADDRDDAALAARDDAQHGEAGLGAVVGDALDGGGEGVCHDRALYPIMTVLPRRQGGWMN